MRNSLIPVETQDDTRARQWVEALEAWLSSRRAESTREAYLYAVRDFFGFANRPPWRITPNEVQAWKAYMEHRGLVPATITLRLSALSSFSDRVERANLRQQDEQKEGPHEA